MFAETSEGFQQTPWLRPEKVHESYIYKVLFFVAYVNHNNHLRISIIFMGKSIPLSTACII
jgi:hypothetical protein